MSRCLESVLVSVPCILLGLLGVVGPAASADLGPRPREQLAEPTSPLDQWQFSFTPYGWMTNVNGSATARAGDLAPLHPIARSLTNIEAMIGQLYPATLLAENRDA